MRSRSKILDATLELIRSGGFEVVNIAAVAHAAGVTRQTVYSNFGTREDLVSQALIVLVLRALADIRAKLAPVHDIPGYMIELFVALRAAVRDDPVLARLLGAETNNPLFDPMMITRAKPVARELLMPVLELDPGLESDLDDIIQIVVRLGLSVVVFDDEDIRSDDDLRRFVARWVVPALSARGVLRD
ncbi:TetR/AcrR family transcriptional regulator [Nocardia sp. alder85J]|uniref:TetR/AcrR family transcriptional regulator n=1 Tax=Nocardia sp. alder85J TaxID=2862949 RepID=UPI001CD1F051|nr:TetR/AcrR family transcriptional regulator [Nocardia sp. alder85J]MCX4095895.1 helix-turn-helix domain containing protein [Nocardia sp. alder85J]